MGIHLLLGELILLRLDVQDLLGSPCRLLLDLVQLKLWFANSDRIASKKQTVAGDFVQMCRSLLTIQNIAFDYVALKHRINVEAFVAANHLLR